jgi:hypothetical protein
LLFAGVMLWLAVSYTLDTSAFCNMRALIASGIITAYTWATGMSCDVRAGVALVRFLCCSRPAACDDQPRLQRQWDAAQ